MAGHRTYCENVEIIGSRARNQPAPPWVLYEDLTNPNRQPKRQWLHLLEDEVAPKMIVAESPSRVVWSSLWARRPDALVQFDLLAGRGGTDLRWTLLVEEPLPDESLTGHIRKRIGTLINANLRYTYGQ